MRGLPHPISFEDAGQMQRMYELMLSQIEQISTRYGEPTLPDSIKFRLDSRTNTMEIISAGTSIKGSKREKAIDEILNRFDAIFNI
jgi:hypothetical protein